VMHIRHFRPNSPRWAINSSTITGSMCRFAPAKQRVRLHTPLCPPPTRICCSITWEKRDDVMTLAHELGHGVHQVLSAGQGALMADTPLTLAETASVFGEMLTFQELLSRESDKKRRQLLIAGKIEDMLNTVVRQIAFCEFERMVHAERRFGELSVERIGEIWMQVAAESLGPAIKLHPEYASYWMYIPHFIHSPFYVYAYAFGDCLVNSLYGVYLREKKAGKADAFAKKYLTMLKAGGSLRHKALLKPLASMPASPISGNQAWM